MPAASPNHLSIQVAQHDATAIHLNVLDFGGSGPIALLHHANGFSAGTWAFVAPALTAHFRVFAVDARGHGDSDAEGATETPDLTGFVNDLVTVAKALCARCDESHIDFGIGSSFGGVVTAAAAARCPTLFSRIAMLDPPIIASPEIYQRLGLPVPPPDARRGPPIEQTLRRRAHFSSLAEAHAIWRTKGMFAAWPDAAFDLYLAECLRPAADGGVELKCAPVVEAHVFAATDRMNVFDYAPDVPVPVLFGHATRGFFPADYCERVARLFPRCDYRNIEGGHLLPLEAPEAVIGHLLEFAAARQP